MNQVDYVQWFEQLSQSLMKNPHETTRIIEEFRESENVLEISLTILQSPQSSHQGKFLALNCLQYALLLKWEGLSSADQNQWVQLFETFLLQSISLQFPSFVSNKLIQVFSSIQKKRWSSSTADEKMALFQWLSRFFQSTSQQTVPVNEELLLAQLGVNIILSFLEEFMKKSNADMGVHHSQYLQRKVDFETNLLPHLFLLLIQQYQKYGDLVLAYDPNNVSSEHQSEEGITAVLVLLLKALIEMITWEYGETLQRNSNYSKDIESEGTGKGGALISKPPKHFHDYLIQSSFIEKVFLLYSRVRLITDDLIVKQKKQAKPSNAGLTNIAQLTQQHATFQQSFQRRQEKLNQCTLEFRNLISALSLMNGDIFTADPIIVEPGTKGNNSQPSSEKIGFGNTILLHAYQLAQPYTTRQQLALLTFDALDYAEGGQRYEELLFFLQLTQNFFQNYSLAQCLQMTHFSVFLNGIATIALEMTKELSLLTSDMSVKLIRSNYQDITTTSTVNDNLFQTWRFDLLFHVFDLLTMIHDDFLLTSSFTLPMQLLSPGPTTSVAQLQQFQQQTNQIALQSSLKQYLFEFSKEVFPQILEVIMVIFVNDSLSSAEEEEEEEEERIQSRNLDNFFIGLSALGRFNIFNALQFIGSTLSSTFIDFQAVAKVYDAASSSNSSSSTSHAMKTLSCMERIRLCILLVSFLLIDNFSLGNVSGSGGNDSGEGSGKGSKTSSLVLSRRSSEVSVINDWILDAMKTDNLLTLQMIIECLRCVSIIYQFMMSLLSTQKERRAARQTNALLSSEYNNNPCISPYLLQTILYFYSELFIQYLQPNIEDYSVDTLNMYPFLQTLLSEEKDVYNIIEMILTSLVLIIDQLPLEMEVIKSLCLVFRSIAMNDNNLPILNSLIVSGQLFELFSVYYNLSMESGTTWRAIGQSLNYDGLTMITEMIVIILTKGNASQPLTQISLMLYMSFETLAHYSGNDVSQYMAFVRRVLACMNGLARSPSGQDEILQKLFDSFFTTIASPNPNSNTTTNKGNTFQRFLLENADEILVLFSRMIRDYAEHQLSRLHDTSAKLLYSTVSMILFIYEKRLSMYQSFTLTLPSEQQQQQAIQQRSNQEVLYEENLDFINEVIFLLLEILNHLSTKEFLFSDYPLTFPTPSLPMISGSVLSSSPSSSFSKNDVEDIPSVLVYGLQMMIPLIQPSIIYSYPETLEKYLSFIIFLMSSSMKSLMIWWNYQLTPENSLQYFILLMKQLLLSMSVIDGTTARMAIQSIQLIIMNEVHVRENPIPMNTALTPAMIQEAKFLPLMSANHHNVLIAVMKEIIRTVLVSQPVPSAVSVPPGGGGMASVVSSLQHCMRLDKKLLVDRIDSIANVIMVFIAWNFNAFQEIVNDVIAQQVPSVKQLLVQYLQSLLSDRGVSLTSIQKKNRLIFTQNFRDFYLQIKNLNIR